MRNIVNILNNIEHDDLLLLDEVGSGTDPEEGAAPCHVNFRKIDGNWCLHCSYYSL